MSKVPSLSYKEMIAALKKNNWKFVRQKRSHGRLEKILDPVKISLQACPQFHYNS